MQGEKVVIIAPAILERYASDKMKAIARMGSTDGGRIFGYLVTTDKNVHYVRPGLFWDNFRTVHLDQITGIEYLDDFLTNTLKIEVGQTIEKIIFYDELEGINFYRYIKYQQWKDRK
ncbi:MAG: hypothetical protein LUQ38_04295 [Methanotrichaceae archaeon]|nr:hypothetical protein [Methanotrichaceae archaeon]